MDISIAVAAIDAAIAAMSRAQTALTTPSHEIVLSPADDLQRAIDDAKGGDALLLQPAIRYVGVFRLPAKDGMVYIGTTATLPERRLTPDDAPLLPILASGIPECTIDGTGAANWKIDGVQFESRQDGMGEIIILQDAKHIQLRRLLIIAGANGQKRAIRGNGEDITLADSHIANIWRSGQDCQAFNASDGAGPYDIRNNYLEASGENIMFGGSDNRSDLTTPSDITITGNYLFKRPEWRHKPGSVKNLLELKNARNVLISHNLMEGNWTDAQAGWAIVFTPVNQDGRAPWSRVQNVLFEYNVITGIERGINIIGKGYAHITQSLSGLIIRKNVMTVAGQFIQIGGEAEDITVEDNVADNGYNIATLYIGGVRDIEVGEMRDAAFAVRRLNFNRNVARHNDYGIIGGGMGIKALEENTVSYTCEGNRFVGIKATFPASTVEITEGELAGAKAALITEIQDDAGQ